MNTSKYRSLKCLKPEQEEEQEEEEEEDNQHKLKKAVAIANGLTHYF